MRAPRPRLRLNFFPPRETEAMATAQRPLSPHLQIYKPQITSAVSIFHRITGVILVFGVLALVGWLGAAAYGPRAFAVAQALFHSWFGYLCLFGWSACLFYHLCNGIRHLFWDIGWGYEDRQVTASGVAVLVGTAVLTALAWILGLAL